MSLKDQHRWLRRQNSSKENGKVKAPLSGAGEMAAELPVLHIPREPLWAQMLHSSQSEMGKSTKQTWTLPPHPGTMFQSKLACNQQHMAGKMLGNGPRVSSHLQVCAGMLPRALHFQATWSAVLQFSLFNYVLFLIREKNKRFVSDWGFKKRYKTGTFGNLSGHYVITPQWAQPC